MSKPPSTRTVLLRSITLAGIAFLLILLWKQQSDLAQLREDFRRLQEQNPAPKAQSTQPQKTGTSPSTGATGPSSQSPTQSVTSTATTTTPAQPEKNLLAYTGTEVHQTATGLVAIMRFKPLKTGPLGLVAMSIRMPIKSKAQIQSLAPVESDQYTNSQATVSENGQFAFFEGTWGEARDVAIALAVSASAHVFIKGTCGINAFQLDIQPTNATAIKQAAFRP